jgi:hypothetical protein
MSPGLAVRLFPLPESLAIVSGMRNWKDIGLRQNGVWWTSQ